MALRPAVLTLLSTPDAGYDRAAASSLSSSGAAGAQQHFL